MNIRNDHKAQAIWEEAAKPDTAEVLEALRRFDRVEDFANEYVDCFVDSTFKDYLNGLIESHGLKKYSVIKASGLSDSYAFQIFQGIKSPSRDKLLALVIGMRLNLSECQRLLKLAGVNELYAKNRRDAIIIFSLERKLSISQLNDILFDMEEATL